MALARKAGWVCIGYLRWLCPPCNVAMLIYHHADEIRDSGQLVSVAVGEMLEAQQTFVGYTGRLFYPVGFADMTIPSDDDRLLEYETYSAIMQVLSTRR